MMRLSKQFHTDAPLRSTGFGFVPQIGVSRSDSGADVTGIGGFVCVPNPRHCLQHSPFPGRIRSASGVLRSEMEFGLQYLIARAGKGNVVFIHTLAMMSLMEHGKKKGIVEAALGGALRGFAERNHDNLIKLKEFEQYGIREGTMSGFAVMMFNPYRIKKFILDHIAEAADTDEVMFKFLEGLAAVGSRGALIALGMLSFAADDSNDVVRGQDAPTSLAMVRARQCVEELHEDGGLETKRDEWFENFNPIAEYKLMGRVGINAYIHELYVGLKEGDPFEIGGVEYRILALARYRIPALRKLYDLLLLYAEAIDDAAEAFVVLCEFARLDGEDSNAWDRLNNVSVERIRSFIEEDVTVAVHLKHAYVNNGRKPGRVKEVLYSLDQILVPDLGPAGKELLFAGSDDLHLLCDLLMSECNDAGQNDIQNGAHILPFKIPTDDE